MCYGENMPLDVLFVRDDDIPDLVQEDVCDLGLVGLNVRRGEAPGVRARGMSRAVRDGAHAGFRALQAVHRGARRIRLSRRRLAAGQAHRHHLSAHSRALSRRSAAFAPRSWCSPARWRSRRASAART